MLKEELLERVREQGISISSSMIERYVEYGLIVGNRVSLGFSQGVVTHYDERSIDTIVLIDKLKSSRMCKHQKDCIFILYWKGYPVQWDKLKARLVEFHSSIMNTFKEVAGYTAHPEFPEIIEDIANDEVARAPKAIGRPTKQSKEMQRIEAKESTTRLIIASKLIADIIDNGTISLDVFRTFNQLSNIDSEVMNETILEPTNDWLQMMTWKNAVRHSDEQDYQEAYELIDLLKEYWSDLEALFGSVYEIPFFGNSIKNLENYFQLKFLTDKPSFYRYALLVLISGGYRQQLKQFLSNPETRKIWNQIIASLPSLLAQVTGEEVKLNG
ncbi:hypothetical protein [Paenibacillus sp. DMB20]|uniref:hypothetical protein n=1 Tax=Paenibacillus sp. DMB20 TaxID=1642570 RepID=UPI0006280D26|nr:hypothetical protein [Paenibacillus sp. DMB20]KKO53975.1 hypothetical protein XI25_07460 [Paenibacillus sp. DMB20]